MPSTAVFRGDLHAAPRHELEALTGSVNSHRPGEKPRGNA